MQVRPAAAAPAGAACEVLSRTPSCCCRPIQAAVLCMHELLHMPEPFVLTAGCSCPSFYGQAPAAAVLCTGSCCLPAVHRLTLPNPLQPAAIHQARSSCQCCVQAQPERFAVHRLKLPTLPVCRLRLQLSFKQPEASNAVCRLTFLQHFCAELTAQQGLGQPYCCWCS